jgi:hypothetical protein
MHWLILAVAYEFAVIDHLVYVAIHGFFELEPLALLHVPGRPAAGPRIRACFAEIIERHIGHRLIHRSSHLRTLRVHSP